MYILWVGVCNLGGGEVRGKELDVIFGRDELFSSYNLVAPLSCN